jgi:hypothetical protein
MRSVRPLRILQGSQQRCHLPSQNWGAPSASQLGKPQGAPPDQEEIGTSSHCQRLEWIETEFGLQNNPNLRDPVDLKKAQSLLLAYWDTQSRTGSVHST